MSALACVLAVVGLFELALRIVLIVVLAAPMSIPLVVVVENGGRPWRVTCWMLVGEIVKAKL